MPDSSSPINTYRSKYNLRIAHVPQIDPERWPELYQELQDIHDSLISLTADTGTIDITDLVAFLTKYRNVTDVDDTDSPYSILETDGEIRVDASAGDVDITLPAAASYPGWKWTVSRIDDAPSTNYVEVNEAGGLPIIGITTGIRISPRSSYTFSSHSTGYDII